LKFRLFNIDPTRTKSARVQSSTGGDSGNEMALDVAASLKNDSSSDLTSLTNSTSLRDNIGLFDDDTLGSMDDASFTLGLGDSDFESKLLEPLFQLLVEVFELKGTSMIRTFRRTLMLGFRLVFGQTMLSKQIKISLQHAFTDANILHLIQMLHSTVQSWFQMAASSDDITAKVPPAGTATTSTDSAAEPSNSQSSSIKTEPLIPSSSSYLPNIDELLKSVSEEFPALESMMKDLTDSGKKSSPSLSMSNPSRPGSAASNRPAPSPPIVSVSPPSLEDSDSEGADAEVQNDEEEEKNEEEENDDDDDERAKCEEQQQANIARLQILAKQLIFASVPTFLNHLFGAENTATGLSKLFDILQYQELNKQLIYVSSL